MKKTMIIAVASIMMACGQTQNQPAADAAQSTATYYGEKITADSAVTIDNIVTLMGDKPELSIKLIGQVDAICQKKGCWMDLKKSDSSTIRVTFKDYGFFMPKDGAGKTAIVRGVARVEETSV